MKSKITDSFRRVFFNIYSLIFLVIGIVLVVFVEKVALLTMTGISGDVVQLVQQFLGCAYILIGAMFYSLKYLDGSPLLFTLITLNIIGFIHIYLLLEFHSLIILPVIYFVFQILVQLISIFLLVDHFMRKSV